MHAGLYLQALLLYKENATPAYVICQCTLVVEVAWYYSLSKCVDALFAYLPRQMDQ